MNVRATYALDQETALRIKQLARLWGVSQAEVIRRSVEQAAASAQADALTPADVVAHYVEHAPLRTRAQSEELAESLRRLRREDDARRSGA
jgi:hypothetical protein